MYHNIEDLLHIISKISKTIIISLSSNLIQTKWFFAPVKRIPSVGTCPVSTRRKTFELGRPDKSEADDRTIGYGWILKFGSITLINNLLDKNISYFDQVKKRVKQY